MAGSFFCLLVGLHGLGHIQRRVDPTCSGHIIGLDDTKTFCGNGFRPNSKNAKRMAIIALDDPLNQLARLDLR